MFPPSQRSCSPSNHGYPPLQPTKHPPFRAIPASDPEGWDEDGGDSVGEVGGGVKREKASQRSGENAQMISSVSKNQHVIIGSNLATVFV